jgi:hypothetical protein
MFLLECLSSFSKEGDQPASPLLVYSTKQKTQFGALLLIEEASLSVRKNKLRALKRVCVVRRRCEPRKISISSTKIDVCNAADANTWCARDTRVMQITIYLGRAEAAKQ